MDASSFLSESAGREVRIHIAIANAQKKIMVPLFVHFFIWCEREYSAGERAEYSCRYSYYDEM